MPIIAYVIQEPIKPIKVTTTYNLIDLQRIAEQVLKQMQSKTLLLYGDMGSGKTTLIKALVKILGGSDLTSSPTFSIVNEYNVTNDKVYHFDLYRIENEAELYNLGIDDYIYSGHYNFVEWPEYVESMLPQEADSLYLEINKDNSRSLKLDHLMNLTN